MPVLQGPSEVFRIVDDRTASNTTNRSTAATVGSNTEIGDDCRPATFHRGAFGVKTPFSNPTLPLSQENARTNASMGLGSLKVWQRSLPISPFVLAFFTALAFRGQLEQITGAARSIRALSEWPTIRPECCNNPKCPSISARDPEIGVPKPDTEYAYTGKP
jgi:hypothetical protein